MSEKIVESGQCVVESKKAEGYFFRTSADGLKKIPGSPIAYWVSDGFIELMNDAELLSNRAVKGLDTNGSIESFLKRWYEISSSKFSVFNSDSNHWFPIAKGGEFRRWYGNNEYVIDYLNDGERLKKNKANLRNKIHYFKRGATWTVVSSGGFAVRSLPLGFLFDQGGSAIFLFERDSFSELHLLASLNSNVVQAISKMLCPTLNFTTGDVRKFPVWKIGRIDNVAKELLNISKNDWNSYEISWDFTSLPLLQSEYRQSKLKDTYQKLRLHWFNMTMKMQQLEEENNRIFIEAYGLQDELTPDVPLKEITLTCNPHYRYGGDKTVAELETLLLADTMKEFISYAVGCMLGRYSLDKEGLILANQGETLADYLNQVPEPTFMPDDDNVIPVLDGEWFTDDVTERFRRFVKVTFGEEHYQDNLAFIEQAIGKDIRKYFLKDFYADHVKRYKKRPIYWMFSSPKGSFNALIYMHRYQPTTASVVLNGYLREFRTKLIARKEHLEQVSISASVSQRDKTNALKEIEKLKKMIDELESWEREVLYPLAAEQIDIDLDDGVKLNYPKFGKALKKVVGLS